MGGAGPPESTPLAQAPAWLVDLGRNPHGRRNGHGTLPLPDFIPEGRRNNTLASLAGSLRRRGASPATIQAALVVENETRCDPPLEQDEVEGIVKSVARYPEGPEIHSAAPIGKTFPAESKIEFRTAPEVAAAAPVTPDWIASPFVARGAITELDGKAKLAGKTTWGLLLVAAVLDGKPFLGYPTVKGPVVYLTEQTPDTFGQALRRAGLGDRDNLYVLHWPSVMGVPWEVIASAAVDECISRGAALLVVDTLAQYAGIAGDQENNAGTALAAMRPLQQAAAQRLGVLALRHERKGQGDVGESGRGSSAFTGAVDVVLSLRRQPGNGRKTIRVIHALSRFDETPDTLAIDLAPQGYVALGTETALAVKEARHAILDVMPLEAGAEAAEALIQAAGVKRTAGQEAIRQLVEEGIARKGGAGKKNNPFVYWIPPVYHGVSAE